jgi:hypothetical protein
MKRWLTISLLMLFLFNLLGCIDPAVILEAELNPGIDTLELHSEFVDAGAEAMYGKQVISVPVISNNVDTSQLGTYEIVYTLNYQFQTVTITRIVTIIDETPPVILLNPGIDTITLGQVWLDAGAVSSDNSLEVLTITVLGSVNINLAGDYTITYRATDSSGNTTEMIRIVSVLSEDTD